MREPALKVSRVRWLVTSHHTNVTRRRPLISLWLVESLLLRALEPRHMSRTSDIQNMSWMAFCLLREPGMSPDFGRLSIMVKKNDGSC
jgi:hypothetical protein